MARSLRLMLSGLLVVAASAFGQVNPFNAATQPLPASATLPQTPTSLQVELGARGHRVLAASTTGGGVAIREVPGPRSAGASFIGRAGEPDIARRAVDVLLPFDADLGTLVVELVQGTLGPTAPKVTSLGQFDIRPIGRAASFDLETEITRYAEEGGTLDAQGRDVAQYGTNALLPSSIIRVIGAGQLRQYRYVRLEFAPYRWNPVQRILVRVDRQVVRIRWQRAPVAAAQARHDLSDPATAYIGTGQFVNAPVGAGWYWLGGNFLRDAVYDYVIVTTSAIVAGSSELWPFVAHKQSQGWSVAVVTAEAVSAGWSGTELADRIRSFLRDKYADWGIRYVLLIGDPDPYDRWVGAGDAVGSVPMKMAWPRGDGWESKSDGEACPTDHYYADLSESWDVDGDGYAAAYDDDFDIELVTIKVGATSYIVPWADWGVDFDSEVYVGRIPFDTTSKIDTVLAATMEYQDVDVATTPGVAGLRKIVYLPMSGFSDDCDGSYLGEQLGDLTSALGTLTLTFHEPGADISGDLTLESASSVTAWTTLPAGLVAWTGHGSKTRAEIRNDESDLMSTTHAASLNDGTRAYVVQGSCQNAWPETSGNLAAELLEEIAVGTVAGTRNSFYRDGRTFFGDDCMIHDVVYWVTAGLTIGFSAGHSVASMRSYAAPDSESDFQNLLTYNLNGDPAGTYRWH